MNERMTERIAVITRPAQQAQAFALKLQQAGMQAEFFPLLEILPLVDDSALQLALRSLRQYAMAAFVSPNAIDAVFTRIQAWPSEVAIAIMGEGSRAALARHGISDANATIISPANPDKTDSETLLQNLNLAQLQGQSVVIFRGESGRDYLSDGLRLHEIKVVNVASYHRQTPEFSVDLQKKLRSLLMQNCAWVVTSSESLRTLQQWIKIAEPQTWVAKMQQIKLYVSHVRIAETAQTLGYAGIRLTASGDENILHALQSEL